MRRFCPTPRYLPMLCGPLLCGWLSLAAVAHGDAFTIEAVQGTPIVDGEIDEVWKTTAPVTVERMLHNVAGTPPRQARVRLLWDREHLYLLWHVADPIRGLESPDAWQRDSVEWFIDERGQRTASYESDDAQYRVGADGMTSGGRNYHPDNLTAAAKEVPGGYRVEAAMRFRDIQASEGALLGIEFQVNDDAGTGQRDGLIKWADPTDNSWKDTSRFGELKLVAKSDNPSDPAKDLEPSAEGGEEPAAPAEPPAPRGDEPQNGEPQAATRARIPQWATDAVFYQVFPERFWNGDTTNDPTRESLEFVDIIPSSWKITPWTQDWYARADWERELGDHFYDDGVFHRRYGGDLQGILDRLDYLKELGINVIYLNPVFYARSLHKYDGNSYHHIDPHFGPDPAGDFRKMQAETSDPNTWVWTKADQLFLELVQQAHRRGIRVIIDGVFNHTGRDFFAFADIRERQQASDYVDWYTIEQFDDPATEEDEFKYTCWWDVDTLPEFANSADGNDLHQGPKQYIFDATSRWMDPNGDGDPSDGIDGWRLDVASDVPDGFWRDWHQHVRSLNPEAYTVAEIWDDAGDYLKRCGFSATMNYHGFAFLVKGFVLDGQLSADAFAQALQERAAEHPWWGQLALQNLIDSHDTDRLASMIVNAPAGNYRQADRFDYDVTEVVSPRQTPDYEVRKPNAEEREIQRLAVLFQMTYVGAPMVYYGSEAGMWGADDPDDRKPMIWPELDYEPERHEPSGGQARQDTVAFDHELHRFYQDAIRLRQQFAALRQGKFKAVPVPGADKLLVFQRWWGDEQLLVAINREANPAEVEIDLKSIGYGPEVEVVFEVNDGGVQAQTDRQQLKLRLGPLTGAVLRCGPVRQAQR
ncbi:MAG: alpha-amylase family glycosyl hydrolase [Planctomycetota bacterium]